MSDDKPNIADPNQVSAPDHIDEKHDKMPFAIIAWDYVMEALADPNAPEASDKIVDPIYDEIAESVNNDTAPELTIEELRICAVALRNYVKDYQEKTALTYNRILDAIRDPDSAPDTTFSERLSERVSAPENKLKSFMESEFGEYPRTAVYRSERIIEFLKEEDIIKEEVKEL